MTSARRLLILVVTAAALAAAFVVARSGDDETPPRATTSPPTTPPVRTTPRQDASPAKPRAQIPIIRVRAGQPAGGVKEIAVRRGDRVRFTVASPDTSDEIHVHGYDLSKDLEAGGRVTFSFQASADGIYEIELEGAQRQIARLVVSPR